MAGSNGLKLERMAVADLKADPANTRRHGERNLTTIKNSLERFGQQKPIVVRPNGTVVAGNGTLEAAKALGWKHLSVVRTALRGADATAYSVADNRTAELAEWDEDVLAKALADMPNDLAEVAGFTADEVAALISGDVTAGLTDPDAVPDPPDEPITKRGDLIEMGEHRLLCGDAASRTLQIHKASVLTDPPYGIDATTDWTGVLGSRRAFGRGTKGKKHQKIIGDDKPFDPSSLLAMIVGSVEAFVFGADYFIRGMPDGGSWHVWDKRKESQSKAIGSEFELLWSMKRHKRTILRHDWFGFLSSQNASEARNRLHPAQKPTSLLRDIIERWIPRESTIVDPYAGSGSTLIACEQLGRVCYIMEIDPLYCDVIVERWQQFTGKKASRTNG